MEPVVTEDRETLFKLFLIYNGISPELWEQFLKDRQK